MFLFFCSYVYNAVGGLAHILVDGDTADGIGNYVSACGVLDVFDMSTDVSLYR